MAKQSQSQKIKTGSKSPKKPKSPKKLKKR